MNPLLTLTASELAGMLDSGEVSAREITGAHLDRITAVDDDVRAFLAVDGERALATAEAIDDRRAAGEELGPLAGIPIAVKDVFTYTGLPTTAGSRILEGWHPPYNATIVQRLLDAGLVILGKTNMDEFAMGSSTENSGYFTTHNPWDLTRIPGGSGGGSSAAVTSTATPVVATVSPFRPSLTEKYGGAVTERTTPRPVSSGQAGLGGGTGRMATRRRVIPIVAFVAVLALVVLAATSTSTSRETGRSSASTAARTSRSWLAARARSSMRCWS